MAMNIVSIGAGPAGLFFAILMKRADPAHRITIVERNGTQDTFGGGVVFSDETLGNVAKADPQTYAEITERFAHWDAIDIHYQGTVVTSGGHGFSGLSRQVLLDILQRRAETLGVELVFRKEVADLAEFPPFRCLHFSLQGDRARVVARSRLSLRRSPLDLHRRDDRGDLAQCRP